jgi:hypothetical protein
MGKRRLHPLIVTLSLLEKEAGGSDKNKKINF